MLSTTMRQSTLRTLSLQIALLHTSIVVAQYGSCIPIRSASQVIQSVQQATTPEPIFFCIDGPPSTYEPPSDNITTDLQCRAGASAFVLCA